MELLVDGVAHPEQFQLTAGSTIMSKTFMNPISITSSQELKFKVVSSDYFIAGYNLTARIKYTLSA
jgi:hypothetical protein